MAGFLGYHPDALLTLRRALAAAIVDGDGLQCDDPLGVYADRQWRRALRLLAPWEARIAGVLACGFDTPYRRVASDVALPLDYRRLVDPAWTVVADPVSGGSPPIDPLARASELAALLLALDPLELADVELAARLEVVLSSVLADAEAAVRLLAELTPEGFAAVVRGLAAVSFAGPAASGAAELVRRLGLALGAALQWDATGEPAYRAALLDGARAEPVAAAMVLAAGGLPTAVVSAWALAIVQRSGATAPSALAAPAAAAEKPAVALVLEALTYDPVAGRAVLAAMLDDLDLLLGPHLPAPARGAFLLATSDPRRFEAATTVPTVRAVLGYLHAHPTVARGTPTGAGKPDLRAWLGAYAGPYLPELVDATAGFDLVAEVAEDPAAAASLQHWILETARAGTDRAFAAATPAAQHVSLTEVCRRLGLAIEALATGRVAWAAHARGTYDGLRTFLELGFGLGLGNVVDRFAPGSSLVTAPAGQWLVDTGLDEATERGWLREPPTPEAMTRLMADHGDRLEARIMLLAVSGHDRARRQAGRAPLGVAAPTPPRAAIGDDYRRELQTWAGTDPDRRAVADVADAAQHAVSAGRREHGRPEPVDGVPGVTEVPPDDPRFDPRDGPSPASPG